MNKFSMLFLILMSFSFSAHAACTNEGAYENYGSKPTNPEKYEYYYYGFGVASVCNASTAQQMGEEKWFADHPEGYYRVTMKLYVQTPQHEDLSTVQVSDLTFTRRSFDSEPADREAVENAIRKALTYTAAGVPAGLSQELQTRFGDEIPTLLRTSMIFAEQAQPDEAQRVRLEATRLWFNILADDGRR